MQLAFFLLCLLVMAGYCLPLDPRKVNPSKTERAATDRDKDTKRMRPNFNLPGFEDKRRKMPNLPDMPGLDKEEYKRYWEEVVKDNPSKFTVAILHGCCSSSLVQLGGVAFCCAFVCLPGCFS